MGISIGLISIKGGVGKTTIAASLATDLANNFKKKVLLIDANFSSPNLGLHMDIIEPKSTIHEVMLNSSNIEHAIHKKYGVDVIPGSYVFKKEINFLKLKEKLKQIKNNYDFVVIDSSPSFNEELASAILASDVLFLVTTPDYPTLSCSFKTASIAKQKGKKINGIIINKIRDPDYELNLKEIEEAIDIPVIARIPDEKKAVRALFTRIPLPIYEKKSKFSKEINRISAAITQQKQKLSFIDRLLALNLKKEEINRQLLKESFYNEYFHG